VLVVLQEASKPSIFLHGDPVEKKHRSPTIRFHGFTLDCNSEYRILILNTLSSEALSGFRTITTMLSLRSSYCAYAITLLLACQDVVVGEGEPRHDGTPVSPDPTASTVVKRCREVASILCESACECGDDKCRVAVPLEIGGSVSINWVSQTECYQAYGFLGCAPPPQSLEVYDACKSELREAECIEVSTTEGPASAVEMPEACRDLGASGIACGTQSCDASSSSEEGEQCCVGTEESSCVALPQECPAPSPAMQCDGPEDCPGQAVCCATDNGTSCSDAAFCPSGEQELCRNDEHCQSTEYCAWTDVAGLSLQVCAPL
jgi:hypothetical protein